MSLTISENVKNIHNTIHLSTLQVLLSTSNNNLSRNSNPMIPTNPLSPNSNLSPRPLRPKRITELAISLRLSQHIILVVEWQRAFTRREGFYFVEGVFVGFEAVVV